MSKSNKQLELYILWMQIILLLLVINEVIVNEWNEELLLPLIKCFEIRFVWISFTL
jgi:hypothetical protein